MRVSSVEPPPMSTSVPCTTVRSHVAPTKPRCASSCADSSEMGSSAASSMAATASSQFKALRMTAVANTSIFSQSKYRARFACPRSTLTARSMPSWVNTPSTT